jgi:hypothetical protein
VVTGKRTTAAQRRRKQEELMARKIDWYYHRNG